ncbi:MAG: LamG domain-containing protein [Clostridia bacterium]|nr:LamG domain-containing protein [Clostridia bacterium]
MKKIITLLLAAALLLSMAALPANAAGERAGITFTASDKYTTSEKLGGTPRTIEAWLKVDNDAPATRLGVIVGNFVSGSYGDTMLDLEIRTNGNPYLYWRAGSGSSVSATFDNVDLRTGEWTHLAVVSTVTSASCYINGSLVQTITKEFADFDESGLSPFMVGGDFRADNTQYLKNTTLGTVSLYSESRSAEKIAADFAGADYTDGALLLAYDFSDSGVERLKDHSANQNHLGYVNTETPSLSETYLGVTRIGTAAELAALMGTGEKVTGSYLLTADIDLSGIADQKPIGLTTDTCFSGIFDGNGHTVRGIRIESDAQYAGFFGVIEDAVIKNLTISGSITSSADDAGGLAGAARQTLLIENCVNNCTVLSTGDSVGGFVGQLRNTYAHNCTIVDCTNNGAITALRNVGGIVGYHNAHNSAACTGTVRISGCTNNGAVTSTADTSQTAHAGGIMGVSNMAGNHKVYLTECTNTGDVTAASTHIGGIVGYFTGVDATNGLYTEKKIEKCHNTGVVTGYSYVGGIAGYLLGSDTAASGTNTKVEQCFNAGDVTGTIASGASRVGGIIGYFEKVAVVADCLNTGVVKSTYYVGGIVGESKNFNGMTRNLNTTAVVSTQYPGGHNYVNSIGGYCPAKPIGNNYYYGTLQGKEWVNGTARSTQYTAAAFDDLNAAGAWINAADPTLAYFHTHTMEYTDNGDGTHTAACIAGDYEKVEPHTFENGVCTLCGNVTVTVENPLSLSGVYTDGAGKLRFVTHVATGEDDPKIEYFGTYLVPLSYFDDNELAAAGGEQLGVAQVKYTQDIESGQTFAADLVNIPEEHYGTEIFAWSFVKFAGIDTVYTQVLGSIAQNGATLVKGGF